MFHALTHYVRVGGSTVSCKVDSKDVIDGNSLDDTTKVSVTLKMNQLVSLVETVFISCCN